MPKYRVFLNQVITMTVEVEADDGELALEKALKHGLPGVMLLDHRYPDESGWTTPSDLFPKHNKPEEDYELIEGSEEERDV